MLYYPPITADVLSRCLTLLITPRFDDCSNFLLPALMTVCPVVTALSRLTLITLQNCSIGM